MKVVWTPNAIQDAEKAFQYALEEFGPNQMKRLADKIFSAEQRIKNFPSSCPLEQSLLARKDKTFRCVILYKHLELVFHKESEDTCIIDAIWNTRQNPTKLSRRIK